jgi:hypothetical protein
VMGCRTHDDGLSGSVKYGGVCGLAKEVVFTDISKDCNDFETSGTTSLTAQCHFLEDLNPQ